MLGVSLRTAQLWSESGLLEAWKTEGGHRRISRESIERLLADPKVTPVAAVPAADAARLRILVVEDDVMLRRLYQATLSRWSLPHEAAFATDGYEALIRMGHRTPDLLVADLHMPGMDGFRMVRTARSVEALREMAIVVVTGLDEDEIRRRGGLPDGIPVFPKPVPFDRLLAYATKVDETRRQVPA